MATKYLDHYLVWNDLMFCSARGRKELESTLWGTALSEKKRILCRNISGRPAVPVSA